MFCSEYPLLSVSSSRYTISNIRSVNRMFGRARTKKDKPTFFGSRRAGEQKRDSARAGEKFFLVGTKRGVKNLPRFGLWSSYQDFGVLHQLKLVLFNPFEQERFTPFYLNIKRMSITRWCLKIITFSWNLFHRKSLTKQHENETFLFWKLVQ